MASSNKSALTCTEDEHFSILNLTDETKAKASLFSTSEQFVITVIFPCMVIVCLSGNCAFLFAVGRIRRLQTIVNFYLVVLAIADIGYVVNGTVGYVMLYLTTVVRNDWPTGFECWIITSIGRQCYYVSIGVMTIVTLDRYMAICHPFKHRLINTKNRATKLVGITLLVSSILSGVSVFFAYGRIITYCVLWPTTSSSFDVGFPRYVTFCTPTTVRGRMHYEVLLFVPFLVALIANGFMYYKIIQGLSRRPASSSIDGINSDEDGQVPNRNVRVRNQIARMLVVSGLLFFLLQCVRRVASLHVMVAFTTDYFMFTSDQYGIVVLIGRALLYLNSAINPFVYMVTSSHYRKSIASAFSCCRASDQYAMKMTVTSLDK